MIIKAEYKTIGEVSGRLVNNLIGNVIGVAEWLDEKIGTTLPNNRDWKIGK